MDYIAGFTDIFSPFNLFSPLDLFTHLDTHLHNFIEAHGAWGYLTLFTVVFCETGLVATPFLPWDSLLFVAGTLAGRGWLDEALVGASLFAAAVLGDTLNYKIGRFLGPVVLEQPDSTPLGQFVEPAHLRKTEDLSARYGSKTSGITRFVPVVRAFASLLAGVDKMRLTTFGWYNVSGAVLWVGGLVTGGYLCREIPVAKNNFSLVIFAIIIVSVIPAVIEFVRARCAPSVGLHR